MSERITSEEAAKNLEMAANGVLEAALEVERDPGGPMHVKWLCDAVREWKAAGQALHDAQLAEARVA